MGFLPDFLLGGRIAVEAHRLSLNEQSDSHHRRLEETAKPLHKAIH